MQRLCAVREDEPRPFLFVEPILHAARRTEACTSERLVPAECVVLADQDVGAIVAGEVDELEVAIVPIERWQIIKAPECMPTRARGPLEETGIRPAERDEIEVPGAVEIEQLLSAAPKCGKRWRTPDLLHRRKSGCRRRRAGFAFGVDWAEIAFAVPASTLLGEEARYALSVEVNPSMAGAVETLRQIF